MTQAEAEVCSPKAMISDLLTLRVDCSSSISGSANIKGFTERLRNWKVITSYSRSYLAKYCLLLRLRSKYCQVNKILLYFQYLFALVQSTRGVVYQWTFVLSQQAQESITANGTTCFDPYQGPLCCVTLRASTSTDLPWPDRADCPTPSVVAELILMSGGNLAYDDLPGLRKAVFEAIQAFFCPCDQKVWYDVCLFSIL